MRINYPAMAYLVELNDSRYESSNDLGSATYQIAYFLPLWT